MSSSAKNKRWRSASLFTIENKTFILDAGPDFRTQALHSQLEDIHGFILTHAHYDHMSGFEELKIFPYKKKKKLPCLLLEETFLQLKEKNAHLFHTEGIESPFFDCQIYQGSFGSTSFEGIDLEILTFYQGGMVVMGIRMGDLAYISDIKEYDAELLDRLQGIETLIVSAPRKTHSPLHFSLEEALDFSASVKAKKTYITHIAHEIDHEEVEKELPNSCFLAYDDLEIPFFL